MMWRKGVKKPARGLESNARSTVMLPNIVFNVPQALPYRMLTISRYGA
jgi:hypothetical protein